MADQQQFLGRCSKKRRRKGERREALIWIILDRAHRDYKRIEGASRDESRDESRDKLNKSNGGPGI